MELMDRDYHIDLRRLGAVTLGEQVSRLSTCSRHSPTVLCLVAAATKDEWAAKRQQSTD